MGKNTVSTVSPKFVSITLQVQVSDGKDMWGVPYGSSSINVTIPTGMFSTPDLNAAYPVIMAEAMADWNEKQAKAERDEARKALEAKLGVE